MSRHELLEAVLRAKWELSNASPNERPSLQAQLDSAMNAALEGKHLSRGELLAALRDRYAAYARAQWLAQERRRSV